MTLHMSQLTTDREIELAVIEFLCNVETGNDLDAKFTFTNLMSSNLELTVSEAVKHFTPRFLQEILKENTAWNVWYKDNLIVKCGWTV